MSNTMKTIGGKFDLGEIRGSRAVSIELNPAETLSLLKRHAMGDWGLVGKEDWEANEQALIQGTRLLSAYETSKRKKVWIISEADRSVTTILFPEEY
jgi:hypothetical protein